MSEEKLAAFLQEHPRMTTILFAALLLLTQGTAMAGNNGTYTGP
jgi:hypothetical protein